MKVVEQWMYRLRVVGLVVALACIALDAYGCGAT